MKQQPLFDAEGFFPQQRRRVATQPATILGGQWGAFGTPSDVTGGGQWGGYRVRNDIAGYVVYAKEGGPPDFTLPPQFYSASLPIIYALTPPPSGTRTYYVVVRRRNEYGIESQNQYPTPYTIDSFGNLVLPPLVAPSNLVVRVRANGKVRVIARYGGYEVDEYKADQWRVWITTTPPNVLTDPAAASVGASDTLIVDVGPYTPGDYIATVALYRLADNSTSPPVAATFVIDDGPDKPEPVLGGLQV